MPSESAEDESAEDIKKPKVLVLLGEDIPRLIRYSFELEREIAQIEVNRQVINSHGGNIKIEHVLDEPCDVVSIYVHGNSIINEPKKGEKKIKTAISGLIDDEYSTVGSLLKIQSKKHNRHFDIMGCYQGALIQDIKRSIDAFEAGTTFTIHASAQNSVSADRGNPILLNQLRQYSAGETNQAKLFGECSKQTAETLFFIKIVKDKDGKNSMIAFKAIAPKHVENAMELEQFMNKEAVFKFGSKEHQQANLIIIEGFDHPEYQSLHETISRARADTPIISNYLNQTLAVNSSHSSHASESKAKNKEPLVENLLRQYQDIPDAVARSYDSIIISTGEYHDNDKKYEKHYSNIVDYAVTNNQTIGGRHPVIWAIEENIKTLE